MRLGRLLDSTATVTVAGSLDVEVEGIAYDSRAAGPGSLFVALPSVSGEGPGGERFAQQAVERGAVAVVAEKQVQLQGATAAVVPRARAALADLAAEFYRHPSRRLQIFAVTGTDGKTTTAYLLEQILERAGFHTGLIGTVEIKIGGNRERNLARMTTPEAPDVQHLLRRMVDAGVTHVAMETSSHALALDRLRGCRLSVCGLTNITSDHVEFHGSREAYIAAKARLFTELGAGCPAVLNRDDSSYASIAPLATGSVLSYGLHREAGLRASILTESTVGSSFRMQFNGETALCSLPLPGDFNVHNALAAAGMALSAGVPLPEVVSGLRDSRPPPGRMQTIAGDVPINVIVDYAHTMNAFESVLSTLRKRTPASHRLIAVFGATGDRDRAKRPVLAQLARRYTDFFFITNEDPYGEDPAAIIQEVAAGVSGDERGLRFDQDPDRGRAIERAVQRAQPGDTVVILGKGHEQSMVVNGRKEPWSDVEAAERAVRERR